MLVHPDSSQVKLECRLGSKVLDATASEGFY